MDVELSWLVYESLLPPGVPSNLMIESETIEGEEAAVEVDADWLESMPPPSRRRGGPPTLPPDGRVKKVPKRGGPPTLPPDAPGKKAARGGGPPTFPPARPRPKKR